MDTNKTDGAPVAIEYRNGQERVNARELHNAMDVGRDFTSWIKGRIEEYGFIKGEDYEVFTKTGENPAGGRPATEYAVSPDMAKELAMLENNEQGRRIRRYFIAVEKRSRGISAMFQKMGGMEQAVTYALMGRVYQVFSGNRKIDINRMYKIMEYALAKSPLTGAYFLAVDIARLVTDNDAGYAAGKSSVERYVTEIRKIVEDFGFIPTMVREHNGGYHAKKEIMDMPCDNADNGI
ncbi:MAG: antA/AntB antirepressor family protein [Spirochaetaceae bacterium]|jgi:phage anti-repressor protein|nr:antA/AntB antirepressor family protein [Spirochaetaceae bacterium]